MNIDGYAGSGDILTKFGVRVTDEATFVISKERFEEAVAPFLEQDDDYTLSNRPKEGDLIFFPLGKRMFEIKFVEHERPFYQLQKNYVYQLQCELFEYEDEVIDTNVNAIDEVVQTEGYIARLVLSGIGSLQLQIQLLTLVQFNKYFYRMMDMDILLHLPFRSAHHLA